MQLLKTWLALDPVAWSYWGKESSQVCVFCCVQLFITPWIRKPTRLLLSPWDTPGKRIGGLLFPPLGIFPNSEILTLCLLLPHAGRRVLYHWAPVVVDHYRCALKENHQWIPKLGVSQTSEAHVIGRHRVLRTSVKHFFLLETRENQLKSLDLVWAESAMTSKQPPSWARTFELLIRALASFRFPVPHPFSPLGAGPCES